MTHHHHGNAASSGLDEKEGRRNLHKDWRVWLGVALMLAAMAVYVLSLDDSVVPWVFGK
jgi:hypothetical protein